MYKKEEIKKFIEQITKNLDDIEWDRDITAPLSDEAMDKLYGYIENSAELLLKIKKYIDDDCVDKKFGGEMDEL